MSLPKYGISAAEARVACGLASDDSSEDTKVELKLTAAYQKICAMTGREFYASGNTDRFFREGAIDGLYLWLDRDLYSLNTVTNGDGDNTSVTVGDLVLIPENDGPPYDCIWWPNGSGWQIAGDTQKITVNGNWSYGGGTSLPEDIKNALLVLTGFYYDVSDTTATEVVTLANGAEVIVRKGMPRDVIDAVRPRRLLFR